MIGPHVDVVVLSVNPTDKRIALGLKQTLGDPWEEALKKFPVGTAVEAPVTSLAKFGAFVELELVAEGFLRGLARSIAGALAEVGRGKRPPQWVGQVLQARDRRLAPRTAPAGGLTLMEVIY